LTSAEADLFEISCWADLLAAAPASFAQSIGLEVREVGGATACVAPGIPTLEFNRAVGLGLRRAAREEDVVALLEFYRSRGTKTGAIQTIEGATPPGVEGWLKARSSSPLPRRWVVLTRDVAAARPKPTRLRVAEIDREHAGAAAEAFCAGYGMPPAMAAWIANLVGRPRWRFFCAFDGARIVSTSLLYMDQGRAQLAGAGTLREARGQGAQGALMAIRIEAARAAGVRIMQSHTGLPLGDEPSPSLDSMRRAGLKDLHVRINWSVAMPEKSGAAS
jgi:hypothetical protein